MSNRLDSSMLSRWDSHHLERSTSEKTAKPSDTPANQMPYRSKLLFKADHSSPNLATVGDSGDRASSHQLASSSSSYDVAPVDATHWSPGSSTSPLADNASSGSSSSHNRNSASYSSQTPSDIASGSGNRTSGDVASYVQWDPAVFERTGRKRTSTTTTTTSSSVAQEPAVSYHQRIGLGLNIAEGSNSTEILDSSEETTPLARKTTVRASPRPPHSQDSAYSSPSKNHRRGVQAISRHRSASDAVEPFSGPSSSSSSKTRNRHRAVPSDPSTTFAWLRLPVSSPESGSVALPGFSPASSWQPSPDAENSKSLLLQQSDNRDASEAATSCILSSPGKANAPPLRPGEREMLQTLQIIPDEGELPRRSSISKMVRRTSTDVVATATKAASTTGKKLSNIVKKKPSVDALSSAGPSTPAFFSSPLRSPLELPFLSHSPERPPSPDLHRPKPLHRPRAASSVSALKLSISSPAPSIPEESMAATAYPLGPPSMVRSSRRIVRQRSRGDSISSFFGLSDKSSRDGSASEREARVDAQIITDALLLLQSTQAAVLTEEPSVHEGQEGTNDKGPGVSSTDSAASLPRSKTAEPNDHKEFRRRAATVNALEHWKRVAGIKISTTETGGRASPAVIPLASPSTSHAMVATTSTVVDGPGLKESAAESSVMPPPTAAAAAAKRLEHGSAEAKTGNTRPTLHQRSYSSISVSSSRAPSPLDTRAGFPALPTSPFRSMAKRSYAALAQAFGNGPPAATLHAEQESQQDAVTMPPVMQASGSQQRGIDGGESSGSRGFTSSSGKADGEGGNGQQQQRRRTPGGNGGSGGGGGGDGGSGGRRPPGRGGPGSNLGRQVSEEQAVDVAFKKLELVGRGAYGAVYRGVHTSSGTAVAVKIVNLDTPDDDVSDVQREVALLSQLREAASKNVVRYWGCWLKGPELWIVMDYAEGGSVRTLMRVGPIAEQYINVIVRETLIALAYLHKADIIHRDIKAANILLTNTGKILLCDFGVAASLVSSAAKRTTFVGTPYWMAPEVITTGKTYDQSADIWSLGITIYEMATGNPPLADQEQMRVIMMIPKNKPPRLPVEGRFTAQMRDFVASCLNEEAKERPSADELGKSKWIKGNAKTSTTHLKDLIASYTAWTKAGGMRLSLLGAEAADLDARHSFQLAGDADAGWEFGPSADSADPSCAADGLQHYQGFSDPVHEAPRKNHPLMRLFEREGDNGSAEDTEVTKKTTDQQRAFGNILADIDPQSIRPAPLPPMSASVQQNAGPDKGPKVLLKVDEDSASSANSPTPTPSSAPAADKASFAGMGASPFRFGTPGSAASTPTPAPNLSQSHSGSSVVTMTAGAASSASPSEAQTPVKKSLNPSLSEAQDLDTLFTSQSKLSSSPAESILAPSARHRRGQSSVSVLSSTHSRSDSTSQLDYSPLDATGPTKPWLTRSRNGSAGSNSSEVSLGAPRRSPWTSGSTGIPPGSAATAASTTSPAWQQPVFLNSRGRSGSRSRAGPGSDVGMGSVPMLNTNPTVPRQVNGMPETGDGSNGDSLNASGSGNVFGGFRTRKGSMGKPSPLGPGGATIHNRTRHGGSDPTVSSTSGQHVDSYNSGGFGSNSNPLLPTLSSSTALGLLEQEEMADHLAIEPLDLACLQSKDEVHSKLAQVVDDLGVWLDLLASSLSREEQEAVIGM